MFGLIKSLIGVDEGSVGSKNRDVVKALEMAVMEKNSGNVLDSAAILRNQLRAKTSGLTRDEKVRVVRALNKAKVRALMGGTSDSFILFRNLDSISSDVVSLL